MEPEQQNFSFLQVVLPFLYKKKKTYKLEKKIVINV